VTLQGVEHHSILAKEAASLHLIVHVTLQVVG